MNVRRHLPLLLLAAIVGSLLVPIAIGSLTARVVALLGLVVAAAGCVAGIRRLRVEHADDARPPTTFELLVELVSGSVASLVGVSEFLVVVYFATLAPGSASRQEAGWVMPLLAVVAADGLLLWWVSSLGIAAWFVSARIIERRAA